MKHHVTLLSGVGKEGPTWAWWCDQCVWKGLGLASEAGAVAEHASVARQIHTGRLPASPEWEAA